MNRTTIAARCRRTPTVATGLALAVLTALAPSAAQAVTPGQISTSAYPGDRIPASAQQPVAAAPSVDVAFVVDTTGDVAPTYLPAFAQSAETSIWPALRALSPNARAAVTSFEDFPVDPYGSSASGDLPYRLGTTMTSNPNVFKAAVAGLTAHVGGDAPEAQMPAVSKTLTGERIGWLGGSIAADDPPNGTWGSVDFSPAAVPIVVLMSHGSFHNGKKAGDGALRDTYAFPARTIDEVSAELNSRGARFVGVIETGAYGGQSLFNDGYDYLAAHNDAVNRTSASPSDLSATTVAALNALPWTVRAQPHGCGALNITVAAPQTGLAGDDKTWENTIAVPPDTPPGVIDCSIDYEVDGQIIASQPVHVRVLALAGPETPPPAPQPPAPAPQPPAPAPETPAQQQPAPPATRCHVPRVRGMKIAPARKTLRAAHCNLGRVTKAKAARSRRGRVVTQSPKPGADRTAGSPVAIVVGK
jgi:hypothetical protein